jgi:hypothetical protein
LIIETSGAVEESAMDFFNRRAKEAVEFKKILVDRIFANLMKRFSCVL